MADLLSAVVAQQLIPRSDGKGGIADHEIMVDRPAVRNLIRESKTAQLVSVMQTGQ